MRVPDLLMFMVARHAIYLARQAGKPKPWTHDLILQDYRFCNVYRELDTETWWIRNHWRDPAQDHPDLFFAMTVARVVNWSETLAEIGKAPLPWNRNRFVDVLLRRKAQNMKVWTGAYMITTHRQPVSKEKYYADSVLTPIWEARAWLRPRKGETLQSFHQRLAAQNGIGDFLAAQVVADTKHHGPLLTATDWFTWASMGAGSRRGMNRLMGRDPKQPLNPSQFDKELRALHAQVDQFIRTPRGHNLDPIDAQDLQNCLCEFDKYERVRLGQGRPRSRYQGRR